LNVYEVLGLRLEILIEAAFVFTLLPG